MKLSEEIQAILDKENFSPNPNEWTPLQKHCLAWGKKTFRREEIIERVVAICEDPNNRGHATINQKYALLESIRSKLLKALGGE